MMALNPSSAQWVRRPATAVAAFVVLGLSGCTAAGEAGAASAWTLGIGSRWDLFVDGTLAPLADTGFAILMSWFGLAVLARLVTFLPPFRDMRIKRNTGRWLRFIGWLLVVLTPVAIVIVTAFAPDAFVAWTIASTVLAACAVTVLGPGLAARSRLDAKVIQPDGSTNSAWAIDALQQVRQVNTDDPRKRVDRPTSPDLSDFITIADRSGNGVASVIAWLAQVLFNSAPWMLQVTVLDGRSAIATLRRNGVPLGEESLELDWGSSDADQHRKLLALAAAFTAMTMADRYPDVRGFYRAKNWKSVGYLGLARMTEREERKHYVDLAVELEPRSLLAEYDRVFLRHIDSRDRRSFEDFMDRLEPIANQAAWVSGRPLVFDAEPRDWHDYRLPVKPAEAAPAEGPTAASAPSAPTGRIAPANPIAPVDREPVAILLRTLLLYSFAARNWAALVDLEGSQDAEDEAKRRKRVSLAMEELVGALEEESQKLQPGRAERARAGLRVLRGMPKAERQRRRADDITKKDPAGILARMRSRTALCFLIFDDATGMDVIMAAADPRAKTTMTDAPSATSKAVLTWLDETKSSPEIEIRFSYACYLARRARSTSDTKLRTLIVEEAVKRVRAARLVDYYRTTAVWDPELKLLGNEPSMRDLVLPPITSAWDIERFARVRAALVSHGIIDPVGIAGDDGLERLPESTKLGFDESALLVDASTILRAVERTDEGGLDPVQRLRAARHLIDEAAYSVRSVLITFSQEHDKLAAAIAEAVFWVPSPTEREQVERFLVALTTRLTAERPVVAERPAKPQLALANGGPSRKRAAPDSRRP